MTSKDISQEFAATLENSEIWLWLAIYSFIQLNEQTDTCPQDSGVFTIVGFLKLDCDSVLVVWGNWV